MRFNKQGGRAHGEHVESGEMAHSANLIPKRGVGNPRSNACELAGRIVSKEVCKSLQKEGGMCCRRGVSRAVIVANAARMQKGELHET
jgi:hypothetical protein